MPLTYRQVKDLYDVLHQAGATSQSLPEWSQQMGSDTGSDLYNAGLNDNWIKQASVGIDRALDWTGLPDMGADFGRQVGGVFGMPDQGAQIGRGLPRMAVNLAPLSFGPLGLAASGALSGAETYTETGSPAAGLLSGVTNAVLPGVVGRAEQGTLAFLRSQGIKSGIAEGLLPRLVEGQNASRWLNRTTPAAIEAVSQLFPRTFGQRVAGDVGGQLAAIGLMGASDVGQDVLAGRDVRNPFTPEMALNLGLGQLPFSLLHLGGKALGFGSKYHGISEDGTTTFTRPLTANDAADSLQQSIDYTGQQVTRNKFLEDQKNGVGIDSIPNVGAPTFSEDQQKRHDDIMASLTKQEDELKANPSPENLQKLGEVTVQKDDALREAVDAGAKVGVTASSQGQTTIKGETTFHSPDRGFRVVRVTDPQGATYADGTPIQAGDKVGFSTGKFESPVNSDKTDNIVLPPKQFFSKLTDKEAPQAKPDNQPNLPIQDVQLDLHQHLQRTRALGDLEDQLKAAQTLADKTEILGRVNDLREQLGFDRLDLGKVIEQGKKNGAKDETASIQAIIDQTKRAQAIDLKGTQDLHNQLNAEIEFQSELRQNASPGSDEESVLEYYDTLSKTASGRRQQFLMEANGSSPFWKYAMDLAKKGQLTRERMQNLVNNSVTAGLGLKGRKQAPSVEPTIYKVPNDPASLQLVGDSVREATAQIANTPVGKVIRQLFISKVHDVLSEAKSELDTSLPNYVDVAEAAVHVGLFDGLIEPETLQFAKDFHDPESAVGAEVERVMDEVNKAFSHPPVQISKSGRIEDKQPSAGGDFVWGMQSYDPVANKLGKHTLPKSGILNESSFKTAAGRNGKPLQDVEIEMMKAVDKAIGGGAFENGMVDVRKLQEVLGQTVVESHVYGQEGKANPQKARYDELMHWFDSAKNSWNSNVKEWENNAAWLPQNEEQRVNLEQEAVSMGMPKEDAAKYSEMLFLRNQGKDLPSEGPRATSYYNSISPFDTKKYPVVRVDVSLPVKQHTFDNGDKGTDYSSILWSPDNLHENLPNTLGWAMVQFVPGPDGKPVMFVGEQQSRWGQEMQKKKAALKDRPSEHELGRQLQEDSIKAQDHPLLPFQHVFVLKAAAQEAARRGVTKMVVSDGETAMMTEMHDKNAGWHIRWNEGGETESFRSKEEAEKALSKFPGTGVVEEARPSQEGGMRLHYDTTLASAAKKLTGDKGEEVDLGAHKNALDTRRYDPETGEANAQGWEYVKGSPVFRNPDGTPKSSVTGRLYGLSSIQDTARQQGGLTLGDPSRAGKPESKSFQLSPEQESIHSILTGTGHNMAEHLLSSNDPEYKALAKDILTSFPEALKSAQGFVTKGFGLAATGHEPSFMGSQMYFSPEVLDLPRNLRDPLLLHELGHALSLNLFDKGLSPQLEAKLEDIRQRAIKSLPKKLSDQYTKLNAEGFLDRSQKSGDVDLWNEIGPDKEGFSESDRQLLYALLDKKELISQSWSSQTVKNYLKKLPGKVNGLRSFTNWVKELFGFGDKHDNLLRELVETSHALMSHGEFLTSLEQYGRSHFEAKGENPVYGAYQTKRAIELLEQARLGTTPGEIASNLSLSQDRGNPEVNQTRGRIDSILRDPEDINHQGIKQSLGEWGHEETTKGIDDMVISALDEGHNLSDALTSMPLPMAKYIYAKLRDHKDIVDMLQQAASEKNEGIVNLTDPKIYRKPLFETGKRIDRMLESEEKEKQSAQDLVGLSSIDPFGFLRGQLSRAPGKIEAKDDVPQDGKIPIERSWLKRFLQPMGQFAAEFPEFAEIVSKGFQLVTNGRTLGNQALKVFGSNIKSDYLDVTDKESVAHMKKMMSDPHLADGVRRWIGENQFRGGDEVRMLDESDPEIAKLKQRYTNDQWEIVRDFVTKQGLSRQRFNADKLKFLQLISTTRGAGIISASGLKTGENIAIADAMHNAVKAMSDPLGAEGAKTQFQAIRDKLKNPEDFLQLLEYTKGEVENLGMLKENLDKNPFWASAQRMEQYLVKGFKGEKPWVQSFSSKKEAELAVKQNGVTLSEPIKDQWAGKEDEAFQVPRLTPEQMKRAKEIEQIQVKILTKAGIIKNADDLERYYQSSIPTQQAREGDEGTGTSGLNAPPRSLNKGAEDLPWLRNHIVGIQREARYLSRQLLRAQADTYLKHPDLQENDQIRGDLKTHFENLLHPDPQLAQKMTRFASTWFMGFNLASTLVNATQPFLTHVSEMTALSGRPMESYRRVTRALKEAIAGSYGKHSWATKEHEQFMQDMAESGERSLSMYDDEAQDHEAVATGMLRALDKQKPQTLGQKLSSAAGVYSTVAMMPFKAVEQINASAALLASFDYYREQGFSYEEAKEKAAGFNRTVNYSGGRGQRPVLAFAGRGNYARSSAMLGTALQSYVLGTTNQIGRYLQHGFFRPKGLTPYEVYSARKAAAQMLGTQLGAAGLLGLPFVSGAISLLDKLFPDLELNKKIREGVGHFLSSDHENGSPLSDIAMTGVPSMLGWDLQSRLSMGNTLPGVSEVNGFQAENLIGPVANIVKNFVGGVQGWTQGDPDSTGKFLPPAVKKLIETGQSSLTDGGAIRDYQGRPLSDPSNGERIGLGLGFQPKRLSDQNAAARILKQTTDVQSQKQREENQRLAQEVMKGNFGTVRQAILSKMQSDKSYNPEDAVRTIAQTVEDLSLPRDLRREGGLNTAASRSGLLSSFSNLSSSGSVSEVARLQLRQQVEQKLGLNRPQSGELKVAMLMDQLKQQAPDLTRAQLRQQAQQTLRRSQPNIFQMSQE